jgi:hypothetical protein
VSSIYATSYKSNGLGPEMTSGSSSDCLAHSEDRPMGHDYSSCLSVSVSYSSKTTIDIFFILFTKCVRANNPQVEIIKYLIKIFMYLKL